MNIKTIRVTALDLYESCPYCFYLAQNKIQQVSNENMRLGTAVHKAIEKYHRNEMIPKITYFTTKDFLDAYKEIYDQKYTAVEYKFALPFQGIVLTGTMDLIRDNWIFEHKTSATNWSQEQVDKQNQVTAYAWAYRQIFKKEEKGIRFNVFVKNKKIKLQTIDTFRTGDDFVAWEQWAAGILENIRQDKFEPRNGRFHNYKQCPSKK